MKKFRECASAPGTMCGFPAPQERFCASRRGQQSRVDLRKSLGERAVERSHEDPVAPPSLITKQDRRPYAEVGQRLRSFRKVVADSQRDQRESARLSQKSHARLELQGEMRRSLLTLRKDGEDPPSLGEELSCPLEVAIGTQSRAAMDRDRSQPTKEGKLLQVLAVHQAVPLRLEMGAQVDQKKWIPPRHMIAREDESPFQVLCL